MSWRGCSSESISSCMDSLSLGGRRRDLAKMTGAQVDYRTLVAKTQLMLGATEALYHVRAVKVGVAYVECADGRQRVAVDARRLPPMSRHDRVLPRPLERGSVIRLADNPAHYACIWQQKSPGQPPSYHPLSLLIRHPFSSAMISHTLQQSQATDSPAR